MAQFKPTNWIGNLGTDQSQEVTLPWLVWDGDLAQKTFKVWVALTNDVPDENTLNDSMTSEIDLPTVLPLSFIVITKTNSRPAENAYTD